MTANEYTLEPEEVHVWHARLDVPNSTVVYSEVLSKDERVRADKYRFECDRRRFIVARGLLRSLLGRYTQRPPAEVIVRLSNHGKPSVEGGHNLQFNVSHSREVVVYAFAQRQIGVDIEHRRPVPAALKLASHFFSPQEIAELSGTAPEYQLEAFFSCWTRKEAYIKAIGGGLSIPLRSFSMSLERYPRLVNADESDKLDNWSVANLEIQEGYIGALVVRGGIGRIIQRRLPHETTLALKQS